VLRVGSGEGDEILLQTASETPGFSLGDRVRLLGLALGGDDDPAGAVMTMTHSSEAFVVDA
jgi:hypothetical protein